MRLALVDRRAGGASDLDGLLRLLGPAAPLHEVIGALGRPDWEVNLVLITDGAMADLNRDFRRRDGVTDVLSFPYLALAGEGEPVLAAGHGAAACDLWTVDPLPRPEAADDLLVGEVVLAPDHVLAECRRSARDAHAEFLLLVIHGCLHLLGWDHAEPAGRGRMRSQEEMLLGRLGLAHPLSEGG